MCILSVGYVVIFFCFFIVYKLDITNLWGSNSSVCNNRRYII